MFVANLQSLALDHKLSPLLYFGDELHGYFKPLHALIEDSYTSNGNMSVIMVCHSMGCPNLRYFFSRQPQPWKDKYVRAILTLGGAWGGAVKALKAYASGENLGVVVINPLSVRPEQRSTPSLAYLMPNHLYWNESEVLVKTLSRSYGLADYEAFFKDIGFTDGYEMCKDTRSFMLDTTAPGVEIHCLQGRNVSTIERIEYHKPGFPDIQPEVVFGDGDGTVNIRSLRGCLRFQSGQRQAVYEKTLDNVEHMSILYDKTVIDYIKTLAVGH